MAESISYGRTRLVPGCSKAYPVTSVAALVLLAVGTVLGCNIMRGDQIVFVVGDNSVDASVDNEEVEVRTNRLGLQFSKIEMTKLSAHVGVMSELNEDSGYTITIRLMVSTPFTVEPDKIIMSLESQTQNEKWVPHQLEVAENSPWRQGASSDEQQV